MVGGALYVSGLARLTPHRKSEDAFSTPPQGGSDTSREALATDITPPLGGSREKRPRFSRWGVGCAEAVKRRVPKGLGAIVLTIGFAGALDAGEVGEAALQLEALLAPLATFEADFEQVVTDADGLALETSTGRMTLSRPGRLRWEVLEPWPQLVLADGSSLWVHEPDLEQVTVRPLAGALEGTPAMLLLEAPGSLVTHFAVVGEGDGRFRLLPQDERSLYQSLHLEFDTAGKVPRSLVIVDHMDRTTHVHFTNATTATTPAPELFEFEIPPGTDLIGELGTLEPTRAGTP